MSTAFPSYAVAAQPAAYPGRVMAWATISSLAIGGGTAGAGGPTSGADALATAGPAEKIGFMGEHWVKVAGGHGIAEVTDDVTVDLLYGDHEGGQRTVSRFVLIQRDDGSRLAAVSRHWNLDRPEPR